LTLAATVQCAHLGSGKPGGVSPKVTALGQPVVTLPAVYAVAGCTFPAMSSGAPPCATAQFITASTRVTVLGQPVLLADSQGTSVPNGTPLLVLPGQARVVAQ
jgi:hypothetical protein